MVYVSLFGALPVCLDVRGGCVGDLCDRAELVEAVWGASAFVIKRAEALGLDWEAEMAFAVGPSFRHMRPVFADTKLADVPARHVVFIHFETAPPNVTRDEFIMLACRYVVPPDADRASAEHARVARRCTDFQQWSHFVRIESRCGAFDMVLPPATTMEEFVDRVSAKLRQPARAVTLLAAASGRAVADMAAVRAVSTLRAVAAPPAPRAAAAARRGEDRHGAAAAADETRATDTSTVATSPIR
jgi:hypothetical protein